MTNKEEIAIENKRRERLGGFDICYNDLRFYTISTAQAFRKAYNHSDQFRVILNQECSIDEQRKLMAIADNVMR